MSLFGKLEDLPAPELLQVIASNRLTGKLVVSSSQGRGLVLLREGRIVYAATTGVRETVGNLLLLKKLVTPEALARALERHKASQPPRRLGSILVELGEVSPESIEEVMREQVEKALAELFTWGSGFVHFRRIDLEDGGEVGVDPGEFIVREGLAADKVVLEVLSSRLVESSQEAAGPAPAGDSPPTPDRPMHLHELVREIQSPAFDGEMILELLLVAESCFERGVLFEKSPGGLTGMASFGPGGNAAAGRVRGLRIPDGEPSVLDEALRRHGTYRGPFEDCLWNRALLHSLGDELPQEAGVVPMTVGGRIVLVVYGDNGASGTPIGDLGELERLLERRGLEMDRKILDQRSRALESRDDG